MERTFTNGDSIERLIFLRYADKKCLMKKFGTPSAIIFLENIINFIAEETAKSSISE
jgi:hypothetical protein